MQGKQSVLAVVLCGTLMAALGAGQLAHAQAARAGAEKKDAVVIQLSQKKVVVGPQGEKLEDATSVKPGDVIEYRATYTNVSKQAVQGLVAQLPVPQGLEYQPRSARPSNATLQMAGPDAQYGVEPLQRKLADGSVQALPYNEYRSMRWTIGQLQAGASVVVSARAKVEGASPLAAVASPALVSRPLDGLRQ